MSDIPEYCPRCKLKVIFWSDHRGHTIQVPCNTYFAMINSLANFLELKQKIQDLELQLEENQDLSIHYIQDMLEEYGKEKDVTPKGVWNQKRVQDSSKST